VVLERRCWRCSAGRWWRCRRSWWRRAAGRRRPRRRRRSWWGASWPPPSRPCPCSSATTATSPTPTPTRRSSAPGTYVRVRGCILLCFWQARQAYLPSSMPTASPSLATSIIIIVTCRICVGSRVLKQAD
jgi:hypothetical protein